MDTRPRTRSILETNARLVASRRVVADGEVLTSTFRIALSTRGALEVRCPTRLDDAAQVVAELRGLADALFDEAELTWDEPTERESLLRSSDQLRYLHERLRPHEVDALHDLVAAYADYRERVVRFLRTSGAPLGSRP